MSTLQPACPAIAEPIEPARLASRFMDKAGRVDWAGLKAECATAHRAAEILASEGDDAWTDDDVDALLFAHDIDPGQIETRRADVLAVAAHVRAADRTERQRLFRGQLASLTNIDMYQLVEAGVLTPYDKYGDVSRDPEHLQKQFLALCDDPQDFYLHLPTSRETAFFALIEARQTRVTRRQQADGIPFTDGRA